MGEPASTGIHALIERLRNLGIAAEIVSYPAHSTVEEGKALRGAMAGTFTKNLLLKDKKGQFFLLSVHEDRVLDLKALPTLVGAKGHLSFASAERVQELLGVMPGALTPMGLINDHEGLVTPVVDAALMDSDHLNFHPLVNTQSIGLAPDALLSFIRSCGREVVLVDFGGRHKCKNLSCRIKTTLT